MDAACRLSSSIRRRVRSIRGGQGAGCQPRRTCGVAWGFSSSGGGLRGRRCKRLADVKKSGEESGWLVAATWLIGWVCFCSPRRNCLLQEEFVFSRLRLLLSKAGFRACSRTAQQGGGSDRLRGGHNTSSLLTRIFKDNDDSGDVLYFSPVFPRLRRNQEERGGVKRQTGFGLADRFRIYSGSGTLV